MKIPFSTLLVFGGVAVGFLIGLFVGGLGTADPRSHTGSGSETARASGVSPNGGNLASFDFELDGPLATAESAMMTALRDPNSGRRSRALFDVIQGLSVPEIQTFLERSKKLPLRERSLMQDALVAQWAEKDPKSAAVWVQQADVGSRSYSMFGPVFEAWVRNDPISLRQWIDSLPSGKARQSAMSAYLPVLARLNPEAALAYFDENHRQFRTSGVLYTVFGDWAGRAPLAAAPEALARDKPGSMQHGAISAVLSRWAASDPKAAWAWVETIGSKKARDRATGVLFSTWAQNAPSEAVAAISALPEGETKRNAQNSVVSNLAFRDPELVRRILAESTESSTKQRKELVSTAIRGVASSNPEIAIEILESTDNGAWKADLGPEMVSSLARENVELAISFAEKLPESAQTSAYSNMITAWGSSDPKAALTWVVKNSDKVKSSSSLEWIASQWAEREPEEALGWFESLPEGDAKKEMLRGFITGVASENPKMAAGWLDRVGADNRTSSISNIASKWADSEPAEAAKWLLSMPSTSDQIAGIDSLVRQWADSDVKAAAAWADKLANSGVRDRAVIALSYFLSDSDPRASIEWLMTLSNQDNLRGPLRQTIRAWSRKDRPAAVAWIEAAEFLSESERVSLLKSVH
jgi:hypothetical protein